tara:strand:+ start:8131 stop:8835 length:705 start_codon:yes stop_codon:yes gene_type:complete
MKAMILAAGYGKRLRPLTALTPKPLLPVYGKPLICHHIERLAAAGINDLVINNSWLGEQLEAALGEGQQYGVRITWSREASPLETGGGIKRALPLLGREVFMLVNGDVWTDYEFARLRRHDLGDNLAHLVLVPNPGFHQQGDFRLNKHGMVCVKETGQISSTYSGIALINPQLFDVFAVDGSQFPLRDVLLPAIMADRVSGELYQGDWSDVGTAERLTELNDRGDDACRSGDMA